MKNNRIYIRQTLQYDQFVPHREQQSFCDQKDQLATVVLVYGCRLHCELHKSIGNPVGMSVLVEIYAVLFN